MGLFPSLLLMQKLHVVFIILLVKRVIDYEVLNDLYSPGLTAASLPKFTIAPLGFEHSDRGVNSSNQKILRKLHFSVFRICYLLAKRNELMEDLSAKSISFR